MVTLGRLEGFYWVARTGGFAAAARAFPYPITAPGVHQQVRRLEEEVGTPLFERLGRDNMTLTSAGQRLFSFVAPLIEGIAAEVRALAKGEVKGRIRIQAAGQVIRYLMPRWMRRLRQQYPAVEVELSEAGSRDAEAVVRGTFDLLVDYIPYPSPELSVEPIAVEHAWWVIPKHMMVGSGRRFSSASLSRQPFVGYRPAQFQRRLQDEALRYLGLAPPRIHSAESAEAILGLVSAGVGYSIVPWLPPKGPVAPGVVTRKLQHEQATFPVVAVFRKTSSVDPVLRAVLGTVPPT